MIRVGVAGWSYADWRGRVYPSRRPSGFHPLPYLARYLDCVEINASFYAPPQAAHAARWVALVEDRPAFRFLVKLHRDFTHAATGAAGAPEARVFQDGVAPLFEASRCLGVLVQFPVFFRCTPEGWERIERIRDLFPDSRLMLELRHRTWFDAEVERRLRSLDLGLVHIDLPAAADHPPAEHASLQSLGYLRLHGRNRRTWFDTRAGRDERYDYRYVGSELGAIAERMRRIADATDESVLIANNHFEGQAVANALELKSLLEGAKPPAPAVLLAAFPDLRAHTRPEGQMELF